MSIVTLGVAAQAATPSLEERVMQDNLPPEIAIPLAAILWCVYFYQIRRDK